MPSIDISNVPELVRIVEVVRRSRVPRVLRRGDEDVAVLTPLVPAAPAPETTERRRRLRAKTAADYEAFLASAGGWKDVDTDRLVADIYADRQRGDRPAVEL